MSSYPTTKEGLLNLYAKRLKENKEMEMTKNKTLEDYRKSKHDAEKSERDLKTIQTTGQYIAEVLKVINADKIIVKLQQGSRYVVNAKKAIDPSILKVGTRVTLDFSTLTIFTSC